MPVSQHDLAEAFSDALWHAETLVFNGHGAAEYLLSRAVRDAGVKVVFTGEILGGYPPFRRDMLLHNTENQRVEDVYKLLAELAASNQSSRGLLTADAPPRPGWTSSRPGSAGFPRR